MYTINWEFRRALLVLRLSGFWDDAVMDRYVVELSAALGSVTQDSSRVGALVDTAELPVQNQAIAQRHQNFFTTFAGRIDHVAVIMSSALIRLQSGRLASAGSYALFDNEPEARQWLAQRLHLPSIVEGE